MKKTSAGVVITDGKYILTGHVTGEGIRHAFDIFKGKRESVKEKWIDCALRELKEESSIELKKEDLQDFGKFEYGSGYIRVFVYRSKNVKKEFNTNELSCSSYDDKGNSEMDYYKIVRLSKVQVFMKQGLGSILHEVLGQIPKGIN